MDKSPIEIAIGQTQLAIEDEIVKAVGKVGITVNKEELLNALKSLDFVRELIEYIFTYPDDDYMTMECLCRKLLKHNLLYYADGHYMPLKLGERRSDACGARTRICRTWEDAVKLWNMRKGADDE